MLLEKSGEKILRRNINDVFIQSLSENLWGIAISIVIAVAPLAAQKIFPLLGISAKLEDSYFLLITGLLSYVLIIILNAYRKSFHHDTVLRNGNNHLQSISSALEFIKNFASMNSKIDLSNTSTAHLAAIQTLDKQLKNIEYSENEIRIKGESATFDFYVTFWEQICEDQRNFNSSGKINNPIIVYLSHHTSVSYWESEKFGGINEIQRKFCNYGGHIFRIFVKQSNSDESDESYKRVMIGMHSIKNLHVLFVDHKEMDDDLHKDYFLCALPDGKYSLNWISESSNWRHVKECTVSHGDEFIPSDVAGWRKLISIVNKRQIVRPKLWANDDKKYPQDNILIDKLSKDHMRILEIN